MLKNALIPLIEVTNSIVQDIAFRTILILILMLNILHYRVKLKHFEKFSDTTEALVATTAAVEGKLCNSLKKMLKKHCNEFQE